MAKKKNEICIGLTAIEMAKIKILVSMVIFLKTRRECDKFMCYAPVFRDYDIKLH